jgi:hypothetical protein
MSESSNKLVNFKTKLIALKSNFPELCIPEVDETKNLEELKEFYKPYFRHQKIVNQSFKYKLYLVGFFFLLEMLAKKLNLDSSGFLSYQLKNIKEYEKIIYSIVEKKIKKEEKRKKKHKTKKKNSLEREMVDLVFKNVLIFFLIKILEKFVGKETSEYIIKSLMDNNSSSNNSNPLGNLLSGFDISKFLSSFMSNKSTSNEDKIFEE